MPVMGSWIVNGESLQGNLGYTKKLPEVTARERGPYLKTQPKDLQHPKIEWVVNRMLQDKARLTNSIKHNITATIVLKYSLRTETTADRQIVNDKVPERTNLRPDLTNQFTESVAFQIGEGAKDQNIAVLTANYLEDSKGKKWQQSDRHREVKFKVKFTQAGLVFLKGFFYQGLKYQAARENNLNQRQGNWVTREKTRTATFIT